MIVQRKPSILGHIPYTLHHTFDSRVRHKRKIRWFADASFRHIDWSGMTLRPSSFSVSCMWKN